MKVISQLNFERTPSYIVEIKIKDPVENSVIVNITVNVENVNEKPVLTNAPAIINVTENTTNGTILYTLMSTDDDGDPITYGLINGFDSFNLTTDGKLKVSKSPNYEDKVSYTLEVFVSDGILNYTSTLTINVVDINEAPALTTSLPLSLSVNENFIGLILSVTAIDPDAGDILNFNLTTIPPGNFFSIDGNGQITTSGLNYEAISSHKLKVVVSDKAGLSVDWNITVNVSDIQESPSFTNLPNSIPCIPESIRVETSLYTANVIDPENNTITYSLASHNDKFMISSPSKHIWFRV